MSQRTVYTFIFNNFSAFSALSLKIPYVFYMPIPFSVGKCPISLILSQICKFYEGNREDEVKYSFTNIRKEDDCSAAYDSLGPNMGAIWNHWGSLLGLSSSFLSCMDHLQAPNGPLYPDMAPSVLLMGPLVSDMSHFGP